MYHCPACGHPSFSFFAKLRSSPVFPSACAHCGQHAFTPSSACSQVLVGNVLLLALCGLAAVAWHTALPLVLGLAASAGTWTFGLHRREFVAISSKQRARVRQRAGLGGFLWMLWAAVPNA